MILGGIASTAWFAQISIFIGARLFAVYADLIVAPTADLMRSSCGGDDFFDVFISTIFVVKTIFTKPYSVAVSVFLIVGYLPTNGPIEWGEKLWEIVCTHIAQAEGKTI